MRQRHRPDETFHGTTWTRTGRRRCAPPSCAIIALACEITAWMQLLALPEHPARRWEPKRLRLRLLSIAGHLATSARTRSLHLSEHAPWAHLLRQGLDRLKTLTALSAPGG